MGKKIMPIYDYEKARNDVKNLAMEDGVIMTTRKKAGRPKSEDILKTRIFDVMDAIKVHCQATSKPGRYVPDLYSWEMYICQLFGQEMENYLERKRNEEKK